MSTNALAAFRSTFRDFFPDVFDDIAPWFVSDLERTVNSMAVMPGYPPYNIHVAKDDEGKIEQTIFEFAVAGFGEDDIEVNFSDDRGVKTLEVKGSPNAAELKALLNDRRDAARQIGSDKAAGKDITFAVEKVHDLGEKIATHHRGIAKRDFRMRFALPKNAKVGSASLKDGLLRVVVDHEYEEPTRIKIELD